MIDEKSRTLHRGYYTRGQPYEIYQTSLWRVHLISYEMTKSVIFGSLSKNLSKKLLSPLQWKLFQQTMHCCHECRHGVTCSRKNVNTRLAMPLLMA